MNTNQVSGSFDRLATVVVTWLLTYLTTKGYLTASQAADFLPLILGVFVAVYGWYTNRDRNIAMAAAAIPGTTVITTPELAKATPDKTNIISNTSTPSSIAATVAETKVAL